MLKFYYSKLYLIYNLKNFGVMTYDFLNKSNKSN